MQEKIFKHKGGSLFYRVLGSGPALLFIHGFGETGAVWNYFSQQLSSAFKVIIPDLPGSGRSGQLIKKNETVSIEDYAEIFGELIQREQPSGEAITVIGHSLGGYIALSLTRNFPQFVGKLGLFHSSAFADDELKKENRRKSISFVQKNGAHSFLKASIPELFSESSKITLRSHIDQMISESKSFLPETLFQYYQAMIDRKDSINFLKAIDIPVLFIIGEEDKAVPLNISLQQCHLPKVSDVNIFSGIAHMGMLEKPEECLSAVKNFLTHL